jgi:5-amino-6-(5-phosphoribosylamino)uracil reductase/diaminohydroxyphosphoribosylaminopyrimidine deaminase/5-amino-6-(5-phosphoribosylamino)uracil reductase
VRLLPPNATGRVPLDDLLATLAERGVRSLMVEGGARIITALLRSRLVDRLVVTVAPKLLGVGIEAIGDLGIDDLSRALALRDLRVTHYGSDLVLDSHVAYPADSP